MKKWARKGSKSRGEARPGSRGRVEARLASRGRVVDHSTAWQKKVRVWWQVAESAGERTKPRRSGVS